MLLWILRRLRRGICHPVVAQPSLVPWLAVQLRLPESVHVLVSSVPEGPSSRTHEERPEGGKRLRESLILAFGAAVASWVRS